MNGDVDVSRVEAVLREAHHREEALQRTVEMLVSLRDRYDWVGIYVREGDELLLAAWEGPQATEHTRIPVGEGICGLAARTGETVNVPDVRQDPRYLECFPQTRSEIVVPIRGRDGVLGEIDIDSDVPNAFGPSDEAFLEAVAERLAPLLAGRPPAEG